jgi:hypothetical protein
MGTLAETVIIQLSFIGLLAKENKFSFSFSVCSKQTEVAVFR